MEERTIEQLLEVTQTIRLELKKKEAIGQELLQFIKNNPRPKPETIEGFTFFGSRHFTFRPLRPALAILGFTLVAFLTTGIVSVQAQSSLPGDFLYPVKVGFNEKIQETLAFGNNAKAEV